MNRQHLDDRRHERTLELAAMAVDIDLTAAETSELQTHLAGCPTCTRRAAALRADARMLGRPLTLRPSSRVDDAVYAAIARRPVRPQRLMVIAAAALLLVALLGAAAVGASLLRNSQTLPTTVVPLPTATPTARAEPAVARPDPTALPAGFPRPLDAEIVVTLVDGESHRSIATGPVGGSGVREIALGHDPSWISDGGSIVFVCSDASSSPEPIGICVIRSDGSGLLRLVDDPAVRGPRWSPDGRWVSYNQGMIDVGTAWIANKDGSERRILAQGSAPIWSADSRWLAYQPEGATAEVAIIMPDGSGNRVVGSGYDPAWSPAASRLVFVTLDGSNGSLVVAAAEPGSRATSTVFETTSTLHHPGWLTDDRIAFWMDGDLWRLDLGADVKPVRLTTGLGVEEGATLSVSRDAAWLMFAAPGLTNAEVYLVSIDGGWIPTGIAVAPASQPIWQPKPSSASVPEPSPSWPPTPKCPAPQQQVVPPIISASVGDGPAVTATQGSYSTSTCSTTGSNDAVPKPPDQPLLALSGDTVRFTVPAGWRFVRWEGGDRPLDGEFAPIWSKTDLLDRPRSIDVPVPLRPNDSIVGLSVVLISDDERAIVGLELQILVRVN